MWSLILSLPLGLLGIAVTDNPRVPKLVRDMFSPGFAVSMLLPPTRSLAEAMGRGESVMLAVNVAYYWLILLVLFNVLKRRSQGRPARHR
jgi:hypothetical protein